MTKEEYLKTIEDLKKSHQKELNKIHVKYAFENRVADVNDILVHENGEKIIVDKLCYEAFGGVCSVYYRGRVLKKDLTTRKDGLTSYVPQERISEIIKTTKKNEK